eukprot:scaffold32178_cov54-Attheya_sp.AAC.9
MARDIPKIFLRSHGWTHRLAGAAYLGWLLLGCVHMCIVPKATSSGATLEGNKWQYLMYDVVLGCLGILATLTAARDFPHVHIQNSPGQSGTLALQATVTQGEMMEHSFYQFLNLWQALYLHFMTWAWQDAYVYFWNDGDNDNGNNTNTELPILSKLICILAVTAPWWLRNRFPVHSFSANWKLNVQEKVKNSEHRKDLGQKYNKQSKALHELEIRLYHIKKWQYVFYKHIILHGLNVSVAFGARNTNLDEVLVIEPFWRVFWLTLNTSYGMEFFMQSLAKRGVLSQQSMLKLQRILMASASISASYVIIGRVSVLVALASVTLNFQNRHHDVANTMLISIMYALYTHIQGGSE